MPLKKLVKMCEISNHIKTQKTRTKGIFCGYTLYQGNDYHYSDVMMGVTASSTTSLTLVYSTVYSGAAQRKHQSSASLAFVRGIHRLPVNSPHNCPVTQKCFHLMTSSCLWHTNSAIFRELLTGFCRRFPGRQFVINTICWKRYDADPTQNVTACCDRTLGVYFSLSRSQ